MSRTFPHGGDKDERCVVTLLIDEPCGLHLYLPVTVSEVSPSHPQATPKRLPLQPLSFPTTNSRAVSPTLLFPFLYAELMFLPRTTTSCSFLSAWFILVEENADSSSYWPTCKDTPLFNTFRFIRNVDTLHNRLKVAHSGKAATWCHFVKLVTW